MRKRSSGRFRLAAMLVLFFACAFLLPASRTGDARLYLLAAAVPAAMLLLLFFPGGTMFLDRSSLSAGLVLCGFSILAPAAVLPDEALSQGMRCIAAMFFLMAGVVLVRSFRPSVPAAALAALLALGMLACPLWFPSLSFSLAEGGTALLLFAVAAFLALRLCLPALLTALSGLLLLLLRQDPGSAAVWCITCILVFWAASGSALWSGITLGCAGGLFAGFILFMPQSVPSLSDSLLPRLATMPLIPPESVPESPESSDPLIFLLGEQYGLVFILCALLLLILLLLRGTSLALHTRKSFHASIAIGAVLLFGLRTVLFLVMLIGILPPQSAEFPLLTASFPALGAQFFLLGLLSGVSARNEADLEEDARLSMLAH